MRISEITEPKNLTKKYTPPRDPKAQKRHKAQLELGKKHAEWQQEVMDLKMKRKELEAEGDETVKAMADRARQKQQKLKL